MGNTSTKAGNHNDGNTTKDRGQSGSFGYSQGQRNTGRTGSGKSSPANSNTVDANKRTTSDPRVV